MVRSDQASAIISDNSGAPVPMGACPAAKVATDISADPFIKQQVLIERAAAKGPFAGNPVVQTNHASVGNTLARHAAVRDSRSQYARGSPTSAEDEAYDSREMANTATRMFVGGELNRRDYESFLTKFGVRLNAESELARLISAHEKVGDGNFVQFTRALKRELETIDSSRTKGLGV
jgi:hypothetical protein